MGSKKDIRKIKKEHKQLEKERKSEYYSEFKEKGYHTIYLINEVINEALESNDFTSNGKDIHIINQASKKESDKSVTSIDNTDIYFNLEYLYTLTVYLDLPLDYRLYNSIKIKYKDVKYTFTHLEKSGDVIFMELKVKNDERKIKSIVLSMNDHMVITIK